MKNSKKLAALILVAVLTLCFVSSSALAATTTEKWKTIRGQVDQDDAEAYFSGVGTATRDGSGYVRLRVRLKALSDSKYPERTLYGLCGTGYLTSFYIKGYGKPCGRHKRQKGSVLAQQNNL